MSAYYKSGNIRTLLKDGTRYFKGLHEVTLENIKNVVSLSDITRTSLGPNGRNKMIINNNKKLFVTSDAATILRELEVNHPAARLICLASTMQEEEFGDNSNYVLVFAGELLKLAATLLKKGLAAASIISGFQVALEKFPEYMTKLISSTVVEKDLHDLASVAKILESSIASKNYQSRKILSGLVAQACIWICPKDLSKFNVDHIRVTKIIGGSISDTSIMKGMVFNRTVSGDITSIENAKVAVYGCPIQAAQTEATGTIHFENASELVDYSNSEEKIMEQIISDIAKTGVNVVVSNATFSDLAIHFLNKYNILAFKCQSKWNIRRLCVACGSTPLSRLGPPTPEEIGSCSKVAVEELGSEICTIFRQTEGNFDNANRSVATIIIRAATQAHVEDMERAVQNGVNTFKAICQEITNTPDHKARLLAGAGSFEMAISRLYSKLASSVPGLNTYSIKAFGDSFLVIPRTLAENSGMDPTTALSDLESAHAAGNSESGISIGDSKVMKNKAGVDRGILDCASCKFNAVKLAASAAITLLQVDHIIMAKDAGNVPKPRDNKAWDDTDVFG